MIVGFTGTQNGMTEKQQARLTAYLKTLRGEIKGFRHGDCMGADEEAHDIVRAMFPEVWIYIHPPIIRTKRAYCQGDEEATPKEYLERNRDIVDLSAILIGAPRTPNEELRSGTWSTIRYARRLGMHVEHL